MRDKTKHLEDNLIEAQNEMSTVIEDIMSKTAIGKKKACLENIETVLFKERINYRIFFVKYERKLFIVYLFTYTMPFFKLS